MLSFKKNDTNKNKKNILLPPAAWLSFDGKHFMMPFAVILSHLSANRGNCLKKYFQLKLTFSLSLLALKYEIKQQQQQQIIQYL